MTAPPVSHSHWRDHGLDESSFSAVWEQRMFSEIRFSTLDWVEGYQREQQSKRPCQAV